jgi:hypothetical protein
MGIKFPEVQLPSNKKFGFFFTLVFFAAAGYFYIDHSVTAVYISTIISALFLLTTIVKANILLPLNIIWMRSGLLLGMIFGPIVLGLLFFILFTPIAFLMRLCRRDELRLKLKNNDTHWIKRSTPIKSVSFKNQF